MKKLTFKPERTPEEIKAERQANIAKARAAKTTPGANGHTPNKGTGRKKSGRKDGESVEDYLDRVGATNGALDALIEIQTSKTATPSERKAAAQRILEIRFGKPTQKIEQSGVTEITYVTACPDITPDYPPGVPPSDEVANAERQTGEAGA
jgi:hypothetical protein